MNPTEWVERYVPGFRDLPQEDRQAIYDFALLWSLFEGRALQSEASVRMVLSVVHERASQGRVNLGSFGPSLKYMRERYLQNGEPTADYRELRLRKNDNPFLVEAVLSGKNENPADVVAAVLIVVYRLRNNLFHGMKWEHDLRGERPNFENANSALMAAIEQLSPYGA